MTDMQNVKANGFALAVVLALIAFAASPARAQNELSVRVSTQFVPQSTLAATGATARLVLAELGYARRLVPLWRGGLWVEGAWSIGQRDEPDLFGAFESHLLVQSLTAGVRYALPVTAWFIPHLRAGGGALVGGYTLGRGVPDTTSWSGAATGYALAGAELLIPREPGRHGQSLWTAGLVVEGGAIVSSKLSFHAEPQSNPDDLRIATTGADLGGFALSGFTLRIGIVVRF